MNNTISEIRSCIFVYAHAQRSTLTFTIFQLFQLFETPLLYYYYAHASISLLSEKNSTILLERTQLHFPPRRDYFKMREAAASVTLTGARALVVRGGDGGKDSTGSGGGGVALLAIPRTPCPRGRGLDARIR